MACFLHAAVPELPHAALGHEGHCYCAHLVNEKSGCEEPKSLTPLPPCLSEQRFRFLRKRTQGAGEGEKEGKEEEEEEAVASIQP